MRMPVRIFWVMNNNIHRIQAENDIRTLTVMNAAQSAEGSVEVRQRLVLEVGDAVKTRPAQLDEKLDRAGLEMLRRMG